jgi:uncharacterized RDD family membrane protein YckC
MQDENPYQSPAEVSFMELSSLPHPLSPASEGARFMNFILDGIVYRLLAFGLGRIDRLSRFHLPSKSIIFGVFLSTIIFLAYYILLEALCGKTPAKYVTGTRVVSVDGTRPTFAQIVGRSFSRLIPFEAFSFLESNPVGWHDRFSSTRVVKDR